MSSEMDINCEFSEENGIADLTLVVEEHKIPVSKAVMCIASPVFRVMLEGDFREKTQVEIPLPGKKYEDFVEFLRCIYPNKTKKVKEKTVYMLLPLAIEYNVEKMVRRCKKVLMQTVWLKYTNNVEQLYRHINLSETYNLEELKEKCIYLASEHILEEFKNAKGKYQITDASHYRIIELALRRHELHKKDEEDLAVKAYLEYRNNVRIEFSGSVSLNVDKELECLKALRLTERIQKVNANSDFKQNVLKWLQDHYNKTEHCEQYDLLPKNIKPKLEMQGHDN